MKNKKYIIPTIDVVVIKNDEILTSSGIPTTKSIESALFGDNNHGVNVG